MGCLKFFLCLLVLAWLLIQGALLVAAGAVQRMTGGDGAPHLHLGAILVLLVVGGCLVLFYKVFIK